MNDVKPVISITTADIEAKRAELAEHERAVTAIREWLRAADILAASPEDLFASRSGAGVFVLSSKITRGGNDSQDLTKAIEDLIAKTEKPLLKKTVREMLAGKGFESSRLENYFYTAVSRLKARGRITVLEDGRIWKPDTAS